MSEVPESSIVDVRLGTQMVGALTAGTHEIYVRFETYSFDTPGNFSFTLPDWVSGYGVVLSGGGGGGRAGNGGTNSRGNGGQGGAVTGVWGRMDTDSGRVISGTIGAGGAGGTSSHAYGQAGGTTTVTTHTSDVFTAAGGTANPTMSTQDGGVTKVRFTALFTKYINMPPNSTYTNGPAGTGNGGSGKRGGGGAGGDGGILNNYTKGGKGGNGYVDIYVWGLPRHAPEGTLEITLGTGNEARDQLRAALTNVGLDYRTVEEIPFDIEFVGTGSVRHMFGNCQALIKGPPFNTQNVTDMSQMFYNCSSLTHVSDMDTSQVTDMSHMFYNCSSLTDGNVRLIGRRQNANTSSMILSSGLTREPFYDTNGNPI